MKSGITHGDAEPCGDAEKPPILRSLVPDADPNAASRRKRNGLEYIDKIGDVLSHRGAPSKFVATASVVSLVVARRRGHNAVHFNV